MPDWIYVDKSNLFIEGQRVSAVQRRMAHSIAYAMNSGIVDMSYCISFTRLYSVITGNISVTSERFAIHTHKTDVARAVVFGSGSLENEEVREAAEQAGFEVKAHSRNFSNKEKKVNVDIVATMVRDAYRNAKEGDVFNLAAGDKDYVPAVKMIISDGMKVKVTFWDHAAAELKDSCSEFISLNPHLERLLSYRDSKERMAQMD